MKKGLERFHRDQQVHLLALHRTIPRILPWIFECIFKHFLSSVSDHFPVEPIPVPKNPLGEEPFCNIQPSSFSWRIILKARVKRQCCLLLKAGNLLMRVFNKRFKNQQRWVNLKFSTNWGWNGTHTFIRKQFQTPNQTFKLDAVSSLIITLFIMTCYSFMYIELLPYCLIEKLQLVIILNYLMCDSSLNQLTKYR